jgi:GNAT superfamily N-acetyltransferase
MASSGSDIQSTISLLDELAANAWPAPVQQQLEGWKLRAAGGLTRRANSVYTSGVMPQFPNWLQETRHFYARQGLPVRFQVSDGSPPELALLLDELRYSMKAHTQVQVASARIVAERATWSEGISVIAAPSLEESWLRAFIRVEGHDPAWTEHYRAIMSAIGPAVRFVQAAWGDETVGVGMAVSERGWTGLFNMATAQEMRGRGVATAIISDLARWSLERGAGRLYLQVM